MISVCRETAGFGVVSRSNSDPGWVIDMCASNAATESCDLAVDQIPGVESGRFLEARRYLTSGCSIIASSDGVERAGLTVTAVCSVTADPPRLLVCIDRSVRIHTLIVESGMLSVNVLADSQEDLARRFARVGKDVHGEECFPEGEWVTGGLGTLMVNGALASFDCRVVEVVAVSAHTIFICEVVDVVADGDLRPLIVFNQAYAKLAG